VCRDDGSAYDQCICAGDETFPTAGPSSGLAAANCQDDGDCREGLFCLTSGSSSIAGEGPSAGLCVADCAKNAGACEQLDATTECVVLDNKGSAGAADDIAFCLPQCRLGEPAEDDDKCRGRVDLVCTEKTAGTGMGYCRPACRSDLDCGERHCNLRTGLCADDAPEGDAIGSACTPAESQCAGGCIEHGSSFAECSGVCRLGTAGCGQETADGPPYDYWCYLDPVQAETGAGDLGYCARLCDCNDDCGRDDATCQPETDLTSKTGRAGVCGPATFPSGAARPSLPCK
jgi:hypothetical protein